MIGGACDFDGSAFISVGRPQLIATRHLEAVPYVLFSVGDRVTIQKEFETRSFSILTTQDSFHLFMLGCTRRYSSEAWNSQALSAKTSRVPRAGVYNFAAPRGKNLDTEARLTSI